MQLARQAGVSEVLAVHQYTCDYSVWASGYTGL